MRWAFRTLLAALVVTSSNCIPSTASPFQATSSLLGELYVDRIRADLEAGDPLELEIKAVNGEIDTTIPFSITLELHKPNGLVVREQFKRINEVCDRPKGGTRLNCKIMPFKGRPVSRAFKSVLDQAGSYRITGFSEGAAVAIRECSFTVRSERINSLFIPDEIAGYKLRGKEKTLRFGAYGMSYDGFQALYFSDEALGPKAVGTKEISVTIKITDKDQARKAYSAGTTIAGQQVTLTQGVGVTSFGFNAEWPSGIYLIEVWGHALGENETRFIEAYLDKYPSSLR